MAEAFSQNNPTLRLAWDSTTLSAFEECPVKYKYLYIDGYASSNVDIEFGGFYAKAQERWHRSRLAGSSWRDATLFALGALLFDTWFERDIYDPETDTFKREAGPWGGQYLRRWRCLGTEPYKNAKGNRAKCPLAHKDKWQQGQAPWGTCAHCGSATETVEYYEADHAAKNRDTLIRTFIWYCLEQPEVYSEGLHAIAFSDGIPAVELSFTIPLPFSTANDEQYTLSGHMDKIVAYGEALYIADDKTTGKTLTNAFFASFSPSMQFDNYDMVGAVLFPQLPLEGIAVQAASVQAAGSSFGLRFYTKTDAHRAEQLDIVETIVKAAEMAATLDRWHMRKSSCRTCAFKHICSLPPADRPAALAELPKRAPWNPLEGR